MKINRLKLIALIDAEVQRLHENADEKYKRDLADAERRRDHYTALTNDAWEAFALRINIAVAKGHPVTTDLIPPELKNHGGRYFSGGSYFGRVEVWDAEVVKREAPNTTALEKLKDVLLISSDEEVSTYGLEKQGFPLGRTLGLNR